MTTIIPATYYKKMVKIIDTSRSLRKKKRFLLASQGTKVTYLSFQLVTMGTTRIFRRVAVSALECQSLETNRL